MNTCRGLRASATSRSNSSGVSAIGDAVPGDLVGRDVDLHVADAQVLGLPGLAAAQLGAHAGDQLDRLERLGHVVVGAGLQPLDDVDRVALGGQHHDRHRRLGADVLADLQAVAAGQHQVQQHEVGPGLLEDADRAVAVGDEGRFVALAPQHDAEHLGEGGVVVDDQDSAAAGPVLGSGGWHGAHSALSRSRKAAHPSG